MSRRDTKANSLVSFYKDLKFQRCMEDSHFVMLAAFILPEVFCQRYSSSGECSVLQSTGKEY